MGNDAAPRTHEPMLLATVDESPPHNVEGNPGTQENMPHKVQQQEI